MAGAPLTDRELGAALVSITQWRMTPDEAVLCPRCGVPGVSVTDHSARPHTEWYRLVCGACGLDQMITMPLGAGVPGAGE